MTVFQKSSSFVFIGILLCAQSAFARTNVEKELRSTLVGTAQPLKTTCPQRKLDFDSQGTLIQTCSETSWKVYSLFRVKKVKLHKSDLELLGSLEIDTAIAAQPGTPLSISRDLAITFQLPAPLSDMASANKVLAVAFDTDAEWKEKLARYNKPSPPYKANAMQPPNSPPSSENGTKEPDGLSPDPPVYKAMPHGVTPPVAIFQPDPEYSEKARHDRLQGEVVLSVVVSATGRPEMIRLLGKRLGSGLDEQAIATVSRWEFEPGKKNGQPVAVMIAVEMSFHLL